MIQLRELTRTDVPIVNRWRQDRGLIDALSAPYRFIGSEVDAAWFDAYLNRRGVDVRCAICRDNETQPLGIVSLTGIDPVHRNAEFHILIGDTSARGQGSGSEATAVMLRHAFHDLNLHRVYLFVLTTNLSAIRVYEKVGFRREGTLREAVFKNGSYQDLFLMGLLRSEWSNNT